jgi:hypothetical protein
VAKGRVGLAVKCGWRSGADWAILGWKQAGTGEQGLGVADWFAGRRGNGQHREFCGAYAIGNAAQ